MHGWLAFYGIVACLGLYALLDHYILQIRRDRAEFGPAWAAFNAEAFAPHEVRAAGLTPAGARVARRVVRVGVEMRSDGGKLAVRVASNGGIAVHEFRRDGGFSPRGPYYVKLRPCIWASTGRKHLVIVDQRAVEAANPSGGRVREVGVQIVEWDTAHYAPVPLRQFAAEQHRAQGVRAEAAQPVPTAEDFGVSAELRARWERRLNDPLAGYKRFVVPAFAIGSGLAIAWSPSRELSWGVVAITAVLPGLALAFFGLLLADTAARAALSTLHPDARRVAALVAAEKRRAAAQGAPRGLDRPAK